MSNILFLSNIALADPRRGTPLHICNMLKEIRKEHSLLVCTHSVPEELRDIFIPYPRKGGVSKLLSLRDIVKKNGITHVFSATDYGLLAPVLLKLLCKVKIVNEVHGLSFEELYAHGFIGLPHYFFMKYKIRFLLRFYDQVIVMLKRQVDYYVPISKEWVVAHTAIIPEEVPDMRAHVCSPDTFTIGYMGNSRPYQGLSFMLQAAQDLKKRGIPVHLNVIVSGDLHDLKCELEARGLVDIAAIHHDVTHIDAFKFIMHSDVLVIPRPRTPVTDYAFPSKLPEYLATGIPVILTNVGPVEELREDLEKYAYIIDADHVVEQLVSRCMQLQTMDREALHTFGSRARDYALSTFTWEARGRIINAQFWA